MGTVRLSEEDKQHLKYQIYRYRCDDPWIPNEKVAKLLRRSTATVNRYAQKAEKEKIIVNPQPRLYPHPDIKIALLSFENKYSAFDELKKCPGIRYMCLYHGDWDIAAIYDAPVDFPAIPGYTETVLSHPPSQSMQITYLSHACFELKNSKTLLIDPFFHGNELSPPYEGSPDIILVTHEHFDHFDPDFIAQFDVPVVCPSTCTPRKAVTMKIGEKKTVEGIPVEMVSASHHQSSYATGFIVEYEGKRIYHPGDTYLDGVKEQKDIDIFFVPIGGFHTMNVDEAVQALRIVNSNLAVPMHYNTFDQIKADPEEFKAKAEKEGFAVRFIPIGGTVNIE